MASASRQSKPPRKGTEPARRTAWSGPRASPTFSPRSSSPRAQPAPTQPNGNAGANAPRPDRVLQALTGLTGTTVTLTTKSAARFEGVVRSTSNDLDNPGVTLSDVKDLSTPGAPLKDSLFIPASTIDSYLSGPADAKPANGDSFRTDTDISQKKPPSGRERELQVWQPDTDTPPLHAEDDTFATGPGNTAWDQFAVNEKLFGVSGGFNEDEYTTKLDRSAAGFRERELEATRIAAEILGTSTNNPHVREERGIDDSGANEEDKYGAVVRGENAYVPPGARKGPSGALSPPAKQDVPKVSVNGPDGTALVQNTPPDKSSSPAPPVAPKDALPAFREFVSTEKQRLTRKRQALVKSEMDKRMAELVKFSQTFKLNKPIPEDLVPILAKDEEKQRLIKEKAQKDSESNQARAIGASTAVTASRGVGVGGVLKGALKQPSGSNTSAAALQKPAVSQQQSSSNTTSQGQAHKSGPTASKSETAVKKIPMFIQTIPPYKGGPKKQASAPAPSISASGANGNGAPSVATTVATNSPALSAAGHTGASATPVSPTTATGANRLNVNASSFRPTLKGAQTALTSAATTVASPKLKSETPNTSNTPSSNVSTPVVNNPFFGVRPLKKSSVTHIKDDFNPFKYTKVAEPNQITAQWPYHGKRYAAMFPPLPHPPPGQGHAPHGAGAGAGMGGGMPPGAQPPVPPPPYEDDPAAQAAAAAARAAAGNAGGAGPGGSGGAAGGGAGGNTGVGGQQMGQQMGVAGNYVYPYPPYGYPGQPMMPGMGPPGPPGAYVPTPFMQPMPYPPGMPPPNAIYSPAMGQMPPYMPPPPPGAYPPPPNGAPRPSMPPTPIPAHAHPYYHHQSPQLQQAVPYMMMPPPPSGVPSHPYENGPPPPVQMGGHA